MILNQRTPTDLMTKDFYYDLPEELIAQHPLEKRDTSRLMVLNREDRSIEHRHFYDILSYLRPNDVLVINDSRVIPARLYGHVAGREEATIELLLLRQRDLEEEDKFEIAAEYNMDVEWEAIAECMIRISVSPRNSEITL